MREFVFVMEQTLGHGAHTKNLERIVGAQPDVHATWFRLEFDDIRPWQRLPGFRNWSLRASWAARQALGRTLAAQRPSAIFIHTQVAALLATGIMRRVPTVVSLDATPLNFDRVGRAYSHKVSPPLVEALKLAMNKRTFDAAAGLVTWCRWAADSLRNDYGVPAEKIRVIPPGVDVDLFFPGGTKRTGAVRLLFVGGDLKRKGGLDLVEALQQFRGEVELDVVTGSELSAEAVLPGVTVRVHRRLQPQSPELIRLFRAADIFVLPTRGDCLPQVIAEAMACGLPVVSTAVGAIPELVRNGENGLIVQPGSPRELAAALRALVNDPQKREAMGRAGLQIARRDHDMARNNRSILAFMHELVEVRSFAMSLT